MIALRSLVFASVIFALAMTCSAREWTDKNGKTVKGDFVRVRGQLVQIKVTNIRVISVPYLNLSEEDQEYVRGELKSKGQEHLLDFAKSSNSSSASGSNGNRGPTSGSPGSGSGATSGTGPSVGGPSIGGPGIRGPGSSGPSIRGPGIRGPGSGSTSGSPYPPSTGPSNTNPYGPAGNPYGPGASRPGTGSSAPAGVPNLPPPTASGSSSRGSSIPAAPSVPSFPSGPSFRSPNSGSPYRPSPGSTQHPEVTAPRIRTSQGSYSSQYETNRELTEEEAKEAAMVVGTTMFVIGLSCFAIFLVIIGGGITLIVILVKSSSKRPKTVYY